MIKLCKLCSFTFFPRVKFAAKNVLVCTIAHNFCVQIALCFPAFQGLDLRLAKRVNLVNYELGVAGGHLPKSFLSEKRLCEIFADFRRGNSECQGGYDPKEVTEHRLIFADSKVGIEKVLELDSGSVLVEMVRVGSTIRNRAFDAPVLGAKWPNKVSLPWSNFVQVLYIQSHALVLGLVFIFVRARHRY